MEAPVVTTVLSVTDRAIETILGLRAAEDGAEGLGLWIEVTGVRGSDYAYDLSFEPLENAEPTDSVYAQGELTVIIPAGSVEALSGATLDMPETEGQSGLVLRNPNKPDPLAGLDLDLTGDLAEQVTLLVEKVINPSLDAHGGFVEVLGVEGTRVFVKMGGGCQGCAVSAMTLRDGIDRTIREHIPEVTEVVDATDHDAGENPFYT